jgi:glycogen debranching enzyme
MTNRRNLLKAAAFGAAAPIIAPQALTAAPTIGGWKRVSPYYDKSADEPLVKLNKFIDRVPDFSTPPSFVKAKTALPKPFWNEHDSAIEGYWKAWQLAFENTKSVTAANGFISPYIDAAFNDNVFMWDTVFILMFARYGQRVFEFQRSLDNFYAKQHADGFICREISRRNGQDMFGASDPNSTGPNLMPWSEWEYYEQFGDRERLEAVFPALLAYYRWFRKNRTWQSGAYWATGWACGMDNQPRLSDGASQEYEHDHMSWVDATAQAVFSAKILLSMSAVLGRESDVGELPAEIAALTAYLNGPMWSDELGFYVDVRRDGTKSRCKSIAGYWVVAADAAPRARRDLMLAHLTDPNTFGRPHPIPTLSADDPAYSEVGSYWKGSVWPSTNYMVLRALSALGRHDLAHKLGARHHALVTKVFEETGTYWENYRPERAAPGQPAKGDFVGWGGLGPIAVLFEYVFGLRPDYRRQVLVWDVRLLEAHGVKDYPMGADMLVQLAVAQRVDAHVQPVVTISANRPLRVELVWDGGSRILDVTPST